MYTLVIDILSGNGVKTIITETVAYEIWVIYVFIYLKMSE